MGEPSLLRFSFSRTSLFSTKSMLLKAFENCLSGDKRNRTARVSFANELFYGPHYIPLFIDAFP